MIVGITGTGAPFNRLVDALAKYASSTKEKVWVQSGPATLPAGVDGQKLVPREALLSMINACDVVVCHAGCGTIYDALAAGHVPVVVPRRHHLGEHVNDHQLELVDVLSAEGKILAVHDVAQLPGAIAKARGMRRAPRVGHDSAGLLRALREDASELCKPVRRSRLTWRALRGLTRWTPIRRARTAL